MFERQMDLLRAEILLPACVCAARVGSCLVGSAITIITSECWRLLRIRKSNAERRVAADRRRRRSRGAGLVDPLPHLTLL